MEQIYRMALTLVVGACGGVIALRYKVPAGAMVGSMLAVGLFNVIGVQLSNLPPNFRNGAQIVVGAIVGMSITRETLLSLKGMIIPAFLLVFGMIAAGLAFGWLMAKLTGWDLVTTMFASSPGGMTEMTIAAYSMGADGPKVALLHLIRMVSVVSIIPFLLKWLLKVPSAQ